MSYTLEKKVSEAFHPRAPGSTTLPDDRLSIVYNKYKTTEVIPADALRFNFIFSHGTGMNKSVWHFAIKNLFELSQKSGGKWYLDTVVATDAVGHGDSSVLNGDKVGWIYKWDEGGKDLLEVIKHEQRTTGDLKNNHYSRNIAVGHSLGGFQVVAAGYYAPNLLDAIIPVEAVLYSDDKSSKRFAKIFGSMAPLLLDDFDSNDDFQEFYRKFSFYKNMQASVLDDFVGDELLITVDPKTGEKRYKAKSSAKNQMATYLGAVLSIHKGMAMLPYIIIPVFHVIGDKAKWNPPESIPYIRNAIQNEYLAGTADIPGGEHLVNAEKPEAVIELLVKFTLQRQQDFKEELKTLPEVKLGPNREKIREAQFAKLLEGDLTSVYGFKAKF
ncbi:Alpha/Beta hydrolase protein [Scheffersomyces xylosifermentans]|uniref:Alpha/Beta hydrolase protein n=1 Tax=Scheffersomyces xylosifermentans TaxID=1304137 RepID=UPI00315DBD42